MARRLLLWLAAVSAVSLAALPSAAWSQGPLAAGGAPGGQAVPATAAKPAANAKRACVYAGSRISQLGGFSSLVERKVDCALVFDSNTPDWASWEKPWFVNYASQPDLNWSAWTTASNTRLLVITLDMFPLSIAHTNWLKAGAAGKFDGYARTLAQNLVAGGLGSSVIRIGPEANGDWANYSVGHTAAQAKLWVSYWRHLAIAMRSVPGAHFAFDWCVNSEVTRLPLSRFYPGNSVVDIVGIDAYDVNVAPGLDRWKAVYGRHMGVRAVLRFAKAHHKPLSLPELAIGPRKPLHGGGDDPGYVNGIASVVRHNKVAYEAYFYQYQWAQQLAHGRKSLAAFRRHFGPSGDSVGAQRLR